MLRREEMRRGRIWVRLVVGVGLVALIGACGDDRSGGDPVVTTDEGIADGATGDEGPPPPPPCDDASEEDFVVLFGYRNRLPTKNEFDVQLIRPIQKYEPIKLTEFSLKDEGKTCEFGCLVDDTMSWIAVNGAPPDQDGFDFQMGKFDACLNVKLVKFDTLTDKSHFAFAKHYIYYSQKTSCNGPSCQYEVWRLNLETFEQDLLVPLFPPPEDPDWINGDSTYKGRFRVSPDGESIVFLSPTIRSQKIYLWTAGTLHEVDYLCDNFQNNNCIGAGSQYSDIDPVAISPDSKTVVLFSITDRALTVRRYSTENVADKGFSTLLAIPPNAAGDYRSLACAYRKDWQFTDVVGQPAYTPDGKEVLFIGRADCDPAADKAESDILRIDPSWIGDLTPVEESELVNLTQNAKGDVPENHVVTAISISPDGKRVMFTATPHLTSNWKPINQTDDRHLSDKEVYMISICGGAPEQLTSAVTYEASSPQAVPAPDLSACPSSPLAEE